jgi:hypothetical protein
MNTITVPMGETQFGTDSGETSGEGNADHTMVGIIRDHLNPTLYWRDSNNPTFRRLRMSDIDISENARRMSLIVQAGPFYVDMVNELKGM